MPATKSAASSSPGSIRIASTAPRASPPSAAQRLAPQPRARRARVVAHAQAEERRRQRLVAAERQHRDRARVLDLFARGQHPRGRAADHRRAGIVRATPRSTPRSRRRRAATPANTRTAFTGAEPRRRQRPMRGQPGCGEPIRMDGSAGTCDQHGSLLPWKGKRQRRKGWKRERACTARGNPRGRALYFSRTRQVRGRNGFDGG